MILAAYYESGITANQLRVIINYIDKEFKKCMCSNPKLKIMAKTNDGLKIVYLKRCSTSPNGAIDLATIDFSEGILDDETEEAASICEYAIKKRLDSTSKKHLKKKKVYVDETLVKSIQVHDNALLVLNAVEVEF